MAFLKTFLKSLKRILKKNTLLPRRLARRRKVKRSAGRFARTVPRKRSASPKRSPAPQKRRKRTPSHRRTLSRKPRRALKNRSSGRTPTPRQSKGKSAAASRVPSKPKVPGIYLGEITHFFSKISVVVVKLSHGSIKVGDRIAIVGGGRNFTQTVRSLQIESVDVPVANKGSLVGLKSTRPAKEGDKVYSL